MISFFTEDECNDIINLSDNLEFKNNNEFGKFSYSFINEEWIINRIINVYENTKKIKIKQSPTIRLVKLEMGDNIPTHTFNYNIGEYKDTTSGTYIFLNDISDGGNFYLNGKSIEKQIGKGTIQSIDTKTKISVVKKNKLYFIIVNYYKVKNKSLL
jgi:hypothetical protein